MSKGYSELAKRAFKMRKDNTITWSIQDNDSVIWMGTTKKRLMDCDLIITASWGGGLESIVSIYDDLTTVEEIQEHFETAYQGMEFVEFK